MFGKANLDFKIYFCQVRISGFGQLYLLLCLYFRETYNVACLGVTNGDWEALGLEALEALDLVTASKSFVRIRDIQKLDLIHDIEVRDGLAVA